ncbi:MULTISPECIES: hypothetical protein [Halorussus]|uniref:hypothetical protein n=1 Tax=Halorussus TaxID=1070314 RepID=UPI000E21AD07|nr:MULTISPECIES: hypothetical protein [Halorussus]NHN59090.1 hypothetical protein [Halorussus sp. JP-T4]
MATPTGGRSAAVTDHPIATEYAAVVVATVAVVLLHRAATEWASRALDALSVSGGLLVEGLVGGGAVVALLALFAGGYAGLRGIEVDLGLPTTDDAAPAAAALAIPAGLVGLTKLVGVLTGTAYGSLTKTAYAADAAMGPVLAVAGLGLLVGVPSYLLLCQVVVQGSFRRVVDGDVAVGLTTVTTGFLLAGSAGGGLSPVPDRGRLAGAALMGLAVWAALCATGRADRRWVRSLAWLPAAGLAGAVAVFSVAALETVAGALFAATQFAVLGLAALTYERTESLAVPALAYLSYSLTSSVVVFAFEAGLQSW